MTTGVVVSDWIKRIADEERRRDAVRVRDEELAARKADLVLLDGRRLVDELRAVIGRDVEAFRAEFAGDCTRNVTLDPMEPEPGFVVCKPASPGVSLTITPHLKAASIDCRYRFTSMTGLPPREECFDLVFAGDGREALQIKHHGTGQLFATADALSEFLLVPVFTGRPR